jgi:Transposase DDE domain group 1
MVPTGSGHATAEIMDIWPVAREAIEDGGAIRRRRSCPNCAQFVKEGKGAIKCTRLSCRSFAANAVRLQLRALAYNLGNFMRTLAMPQTAEPWSLKPAREADQDRHQGRQPWAVRLRFRWPKSRCRGRCSRRSCR